MKKRIIWLAALAVILFIVPLGAYAGDPVEIAFETISQSPGYGTAYGQNPMLKIITAPPPNPIFGLSPEDQAEVESADYSSHFVIVAFWGSSGSSQAHISNIYQYKEAAWVLADIPTISDESGGLAPYQIVRIEKSQMSDYGNITFRLLKDFEEKAKAVQNISAGPL